jgi:hypothetical protein
MVVSTRTSTSIDPAVADMIRFSPRMKVPVMMPAVQWIEVFVVWMDEVEDVILPAAEEIPNESILPFKDSMTSILEYGKERWMNGIAAEGTCIVTVIERQSYCPELSSV